MRDPERVDDVSKFGTVPPIDGWTHPPKVEREHSEKKTKQEGIHLAGRAHAPNLTRKEIWQKKKRATICGPFQNQFDQLA